MKRRFRRLRRIIRWGITLAVGLPLLAWLFLPWPVSWKWREPERTSFMKYRTAEAAEKGADISIRYDWIPLSRMSPDVVQAVILAEDQRFRLHGGVDWLALADEVGYDGEPPFRWTHPSDLVALARAVRRVWRDRAEMKGRSTITQQLAKNLYFTPERSLRRKAGEFVVAQRLEWFLDKDRILELYLNTAEFGPGVFGVEAASRHYFGIGASGLDRQQAATLAATLPHPLSSNLHSAPSQMEARRGRILGMMGR